MGFAGGSETVSSHVRHFVACPGSPNELEPCNGQSRVASSVASSRDPNPLAQAPGSPISPVAGRNQGDASADSVCNPQAGLSSSILLSTSADVLQGVGSTSCNLLPNSSSSRSSLTQSLAPLPQRLASVFADLTNVTASELNAGAELESGLPSGAVDSWSADGRDPVTVDRVGLSESSRDPSFPSTVGSATTDDPGADELDPMVVGSPESNSAFKSMLPVMDSSAGISTSSGDQDAVMTVERGKSISELEQELIEERELEDGELSWGRESGEDDDDAVNFRDDKYDEDLAKDENDEDGIVDYSIQGLKPVVMGFGVDERINQATVGGFANQFANDHKKASKRRKGKGALSRQRKRFRVEKAQKSLNEPIIDVSSNGRQQGDHVISTRRIESSGTGRMAGEKQQQSGCNIVEVDTGPEEGEVIEEDNRGLLSQLVEEEVGLWTTDVGDEQITSSKIESDEDGKKKARAPISAERKLKKKVAFRRKRAEKEKELGIRRPRLSVSTFKPKVPLCKFYVKGRCTLGTKCTFSHDVVPITKSDPCKFFMVKRCLKGDDCPFSHTLDTFPCKFWHTRGHCLDGNKCRFSHGPLTDDQRQSLAKRIEHDNKEQLNMPDIPTDFNDTPEDAESEYMPTLNSGQNDASGWDVNIAQASKEDTACYASTSMASESLLNNREVPLAVLDASFGANQTNLDVGEVRREKFQVTETYKEDPPTENAVLLAARKAASAAAVQAAGTADKLLLCRSVSATSISFPGSRLFGRSLSGRGTEASAMDLLQASFSSDDRYDFSRTARPSLTRGSPFGHTRPLAMPGNKASAMELLQASLANEATLDNNTREVDFRGL